MLSNPMNGLDARNPQKPGMVSFAITPSDTDDLTTGTRFIVVGVTGNLKVSLIDDPVSHSGVVIANVPAGKVLELAVRKVWASGTAATSIVGLA